MQFDSTEELARHLVQLRLISDEQLAECQSQHPVSSDPGSLLKALEKTHALTGYQIQRIRSGDDSPLVLGNCRLLYQNASGSFARVYRGCDIDSGAMLGVKVLRQRYVDDPKSVGHFHREAELCMKLTHKNIVPIYGVATEGDHHFFTMEFVEGGNLRDFIRIRGNVAPHELLRCGVDMGEGLEYALTQGVTHRDFKPSNVLMSMRGVAKLVDFGLAGDETSSSDESVQAVEYATLEKNTGAPRNDPRSDLFFLGAILYELAAGTSPWTGGGKRESRKQFSRYTGVRPIRKVDPNVPGDVADIIDRLLRVNPNERYQSATEAVADLKTALANHGDEQDGEHKQPRISTVMCVESRVKQQDMLREYLSKHGFRVLMLSSWERAMKRLKTNPPDCLLLMGETLTGEGSAAVYNEALAWSKAKDVSCVIVLPKQESEIKDSLRLNRSSRAMVNSVTLRELRGAIVDALQAQPNRE
jgi:serine/threonine protein kinase